MRFMMGRYIPEAMRSFGPEPCTKMTSGNGPDPAGNLRSPTKLNEPDWKVISSTLGGGGVTGGVGVAEGAEEQAANSRASRKI
jgi:hypothetical protein